MSTLTLRNAEQKDALVQAVAYMNDYMSDLIGDRSRELEYVTESDFDTAMNEIVDLRRRQKFAQAFSVAVKDVPVGISVFLEPLETEVIREGLQSVVDNNIMELEDPLSLDEVFSVHNIKQAVLASQTSWGALDVDFLSNKLSEQARQTVDSNSAAQDLLDALV